MTDLTNEDRAKLAERAAGVADFITDEPTNVSGGPLDDAESAKALEGDEDIQLSQEPLYVEDEEDSE